MRGISGCSLSLCVSFTNGFSHTRSISLIFGSHSLFWYIANGKTIYKFDTEC